MISTSTASLAACWRIDREGVADYPAREVRYGVFQREGRSRKQQDPGSLADAQTQLLVDTKRLARRLLDRLRSLQAENKAYRVPASSPLAKALDNSVNAVE